MFPKQPPKTIIDNRLSNWPVRDQGDRGTCVAFSLVACREHLASQSGISPAPHLSEQFLFWAAKQLDGLNGLDGTHIRFGQDALAYFGTCHNADWPYVDKQDLSNVTQASVGVPSSQTRGAALHWAHKANHRSQSTSASGNAQRLLNLLQTTGRPVAISLSVWYDPALRDPGLNNWTTPLGWTYGRVLDPPPGAIPHVYGHAVCVTGHVEDSSEPKGGYFIVRNSWGTRWASQAPDPICHAPEAGYGMISASYVDDQLWEICCL